MVLDISLPNTKHYTVWIKDKVCQSWKRSCPFLSVTAIEKEAFVSLSTTVTNLLIYYDWMVKAFPGGLPQMDALMLGDEEVHRYISSVRKLDFPNAAVSKEGQTDSIVEDEKIILIDFLRKVNSNLIRKMY